MKKCSKCKKAKPASAFNVDRSRGDGLACTCRDCARAHGRKKYAENLDAERARCARRRHADPERERARLKAIRDRDPDKARERVRKSSRKFRVEHPAEYRLKVRRDNAQRRARRYDSPSRASVDQIRTLIGSAGGLCSYCNRPHGDAPHVDHIIPLARGGLDVIANLAVACAPCNHAKWCRLLFSIPHFARAMAAAAEPFKSAA